MKKIKLAALVFAAGFVASCGASPERDSSLWRIVFMCRQMEISHSNHRVCPGRTVQGRRFAGICRAAGILVR